MRIVERNQLKEATDLNRNVTYSASIQAELRIGKIEMGYDNLKVLCGFRQRGLGAKEGHFHISVQMGHEAEA